MPRPEKSRSCMVTKNNLSTKLRNHLSPEVNAKCLSTHRFMEYLGYYRQH